MCFLLIVFLIPFSIVGCKKEAVETGSGSASTHANTEKINLQFAQWSVASTKQIEDTVNRFNETNKENIHVNVLKIPLDRYTETLNMLNASGVGPDVFEVLREWLNSYVHKGWAADISPFIDDSFLKKFPGWAVDFARDSLYHNSFYSIPSGQITYRLIYNKDLFREAGLDPEAPPKTLSELGSYAKMISDAGKGKRKYGFALPMGEVWMGFVQPMEASNCFSGVYFFDFRKGKYDLTVYKPWFECIKSLKENGGLFPGMESMKSDLAMAQFAEGNIGMVYAASWQASLLYEQFKPKCDWGVALPPAIDESSIGKGAVKIDTAGWYVVNSRTKHLDDAVKVWKYLYSYDYLGGLFDSGSMIPVVNGIIQDPNHQTNIPNFKEFYPGKNDSIYPDTPLDMEEWSRKNLYLAFFTGNQNDQILLEESNRLNTLFDVAVTAKTLNVSDYYNPDFNPINPMRQKK